MAKSKKTAKNGSGRSNSSPELASPRASNGTLQSAPSPSRSKSKAVEEKSSPRPRKRKSMLSKSKTRSLSSPSLNARSSTMPEALLPVPVRFKLDRRFYEALAMLSVLGRNRGGRVDEEEFEAELEVSDLSSDKLRRSFVRSLAYLCDYMKGGDTTTAIALQSTPQGVVFWFASNKCSDRKFDGYNDRVRSFLEQVLGYLVGLDPKDTTELESELFMKSVNFSSKRIAEYVKLLGQELDPILQGLDDSKEESDAPLRTWLHNLKVASKLPIDICRICYESRHSAEFRNLQHRAKAGEPSFRRFEQLRHIIGRLNHTMKAVKVVVTTGVHLPHLFDNFKVERERPHPRSSESPLAGQNPTLMEIIGRMSNNPEEISHYCTALQEMDEKFELSKQLQAQCQSANWKPRVHAELLLLDHFATEKLAFVDGDKYIGCSKPACYCCYHYIQAHPGGFVIPACHNNNWLNWKAPDIQDDSKLNLIKQREIVLQKMIEKIKKDVFTQIDQRRGPGVWKADSFTEISTIRLKGPEVRESYKVDSSDEMGPGEESDSMAESGSSSNAESDIGEGRVASEMDMKSGDDINSEDSKSEFKDGLDFATEVQEEEHGNDSDDDEDDDDSESGGVSLLAVYTI